jgi:hypothetical protein
VAERFAIDSGCWALLRPTWKFLRVACFAQFEQSLLSLGILTPQTALECLEVHEIAGFRRDADSQTIVCRNCHRKLTSGLLDAGIPMVRERDPLERAAQCMRALAATMRAEADALDRWARSLDSLKREDQYVVEPKS